jgi:hypothetical protein
MWKSHRSRVTKGPDATLKSNGSDNNPGKMKNPTEVCRNMSFHIPAYPKGLTARSMRSVRRRFLRCNCRRFRRGNASRIARDDGRKITHAARRSPGTHCVFELRFRSLQVLLFARMHERELSGIVSRLGLPKCDLQRRTDDRKGRTILLFSKRWRCQSDHDTCGYELTSHGYNLPVLGFRDRRGGLFLASIRNDFRSGGILQTSQN